MNPDNLKSSWRQYKAMNSLPDIQEEEILSIIEPKPNTSSWQLPRRVTQNTLICAFLVLFLNGGCTV